MYAIFTQLFLLVAATTGVFGFRRGQPKDVIWFPIDEIRGGYHSSKGDVYIGGWNQDWRPSGSVLDINMWARSDDSNDKQREHLNNRKKRSAYAARQLKQSSDLPRRNRFARDDEEESQSLINLFGRPPRVPEYVNDFDLWSTLARKPTSEADAIVFPGRTNRLQEASAECLENCPVTPQYNPVCGSDYSTYKNLGTLKCASLCGRSVTLAHHGICGGKLPFFFTPTPKDRRAKN